MWKINVVMGDVRLTFTVEGFTEREGRIRFTDEKTGNACNYPSEHCFVEGLK